MAEQTNQSLDDLQAILCPLELSFSSLTAGQLKNNLQWERLLKHRRPTKSRLYPEVPSGYAEGIDELRPEYVLICPRDSHVSASVSAGAKLG